MSKTKSFLKKSFIILTITTMVVLGVFIWFFVYNDAPILKGQVLYNVRYKKNLTLDIYQPTNIIHTKSPVVIFFHGGAWVMGRKESINVNRFNGAINALRQKGYAVVSPEYTLATKGKSPFPDCIIDAIDAFIWIEKNAEKYNFDLENIGVFGESAGAHISLMSVLGQNEDLPVSTISMKYIVDVYGPTDLQELYEMPALDSLSELLSKVPKKLRSNLDITQYLFGFDPNLDSARTHQFIDKYSPLNYLEGDIPPILMIHGNKDKLVPITQSFSLEKKLQSNQIDYKMHVLDQVDHAFINATKEQKSNVQQWIVDFIQSKYQ